MDKEKEVPKVEESKQEVVEVINEKMEEFFSKEQKRYPCHSLWASNLGHPCLRFLAHTRLDWDKKDLPGIFLQRIFGEGKLQEGAVRDIMSKLGFRIIRSQEPFNWKEYQISGRIEGIMSYERIEYPVEIKSMSPYIFDGIRTIEDMKNHKKFYIRGYPTQLAIYQLHAEREQGLFLLKNKSTGEIRPLLCPLDYDLAQEALDKAEIVNGFVERKEYPERMLYDPDICDDCWFRTVCLPEKKALECAEILEDPKFIEMLNRKEELKPDKAEYEKIDKAIKAILDTQESKSIFAGDWLISGGEVHKKGFTVNETNYTSWKFKKLKKEE